jgi:glycosyltransferase involved in cell wall biosynthesis
LADVVVVATQELASLYSDCESVVVLPNMLSPRIWGKAAQPALDDSARHLRVALVGGMDHFADFSILRTLVQRAKFIDWVCYGDGAIQAIKSFGAQPVLTIPSNFHYESHPDRLRNLAADIAICPLLDTAFNRCKSDIKFIEFAYLGVPIIASRLPGYVDSIFDSKNGYLCETTAEWSDRIDWISDHRREVLECGHDARNGVTEQRLLNVSGCPYADKYKTILVPELV